MKRILTVVWAVIFISVNLWAHEEPAKTLNEKSKKQDESDKVAKAHLKKTWAWNYVASEGKVSESGSRIMSMEYDPEGRLSAVEAWKEDTLDLRVEYGFDEKGNMWADSDFSSKHQLLEWNAYVYDDAGRVISGKSFDATGLLTGRFFIQGSEDKTELSFFKYKPGDTLEYKLIYKYASDYDKEDYAEVIKMDAAGKVLMKVTKKYNAQGQQIEKSIYDGDSALSFTFTFGYDQQGNMSKITKRKADGSIEWYDEYTHNDQGICTLVKSYDGDGVLTEVVKYVFEYYE